MYATADGADDRGEGIPLRSGTLPYGVSAGSPAIATVDLSGDDQQQSSVSCIASKGAAVVDGSRAPKVELDGPTERTGIILFYVTHIGGASADDHSDLPASVRFTSSYWSAKLAVTVTGNCVDDDGESLTLAFHSLPFGVFAGRRVGAAVSILKKNSSQIRESNSPSSAVPTPESEGLTMAAVWFNGELDTARRAATRPAP